MPFNPSEKILFVHIPKTGGTSIEQFFNLCHVKNYWFDRWDKDRDAFVEKHQTKCNSQKLLYEPQHYPVEVLKDLIEGYDEYFKFSFVRNPYTKMLSEYFWLNKQKLGTSQKFNNRDFRNWCFDFLSCLNGSHKELQVNYFDHTINFVGKYETLVPDFKRLIEQLCKWSSKLLKYKYKTLPVLNSTWLNKAKLISQIDHETKELIYRTYKEDFNRFGYDHQL